MDDLKAKGRRVCWASWCVGTLLLVLLALPALAQETEIERMDREVTALVGRAKPSVVSVRVGSRRSGRANTRSQRGVRASAGRAQVKGDAIVLDPSGAGASLELLGPDGSQRLSFDADGATVRALVQPSRVGTGFVVDADGIVLTTADVVGNSQQVQVQLSDGREVDGKVLGSDAPTGVAVVKVDSGSLPALRLAEGEHPAPGQWAIIIGNQLDRSDSVWVGTVARADATLAGAMPQGRLLEIHCPVGAGASGAPVLNSRGEVIGVVVATANPFLRLGDVGAAASDQAWARLGEKFGNNSEFQRHVEQLGKAAAQLGQKAGERAAAFAEQQQKAQANEKESAESEARREKREAEQERRLEKLGDELDAKLERQGEKLGATAERLGALIARRAELLAEQKETADRKGGKEPDRSAAERQRLEREIDQLRRELERQQGELVQQLGKLNELLPNAPGVREIGVELKPEIAEVVAQAQAIVKEAVGAAVAAAEAAPPDPPAPAAPSTPAAPPVIPVPPAPAAPLAPTAAPASPVPPAPPALRFWAGRSPGEGASTYAIPAATVRSALVEIREHGRVSHPFLGAHLADLKPEERERLKAPEEARVRVVAVVPGSPAQEAGLQREDLILEFQGKKVESAANLVEMMGQARAGDRVSLGVWRGGERRTLQAALRELPPQAFSPRTFVMPPGAFAMPSPMPRIQPWRGPVIRAQPGRGPRAGVMNLFAPGRVAAAATGTGRSAQVTLEAQDAELQEVLRALSRATHREFTAEGDAAHQRITLKVENVPMEDLVQSLERLYHLRVRRRGDGYSFQSR